MVKSQYKIILIWGIAFTIIIGGIELLLYKFCTDDIMCFALLIVPFLLGALLKLEGLALLIVSLTFWFLLGSLIGFLIYKIKKK